MPIFSYAAASIKSPNSPSTAICASSVFFQRYAWSKIAISGIQLVNTEFAAVAISKSPFIANSTEPRSSPNAPPGITLIFILPSVFSYTLSAISLAPL